MKTPDLHGGVNESHEFEVLDYLEEWYPTTPDVFGIDWSRVTLKVTGSLKRTYGKAVNHRDGSYEMRISKKLMREKPERAKKTIRHEAVHLWQYQNGNETGGHGQDFQQWCDRFDIQAKADEPASDHKFELVCKDSCGTIAKRMKESKTVKHPEQYSCNCGADIKVVDVRDGSV